MNASDAVQRRLSRRRWPQRIIPFLLLLATPLVLFFINGVFLSHPDTAQVEGVPLALSVSSSSELRILSWNVAKLWLHQGGVDFVSPECARAHIAEVGKIIRSQKPDLVFLSEMVGVCGPSGVRPLDLLSEETGLPVKAFGEVYNIGVPGYRVTGGNAILSRYPLQPLGNQRFPGEAPFWKWTGTRRVLWCEVGVGGAGVPIASLHLESVDSDIRMTQVAGMLHFESRPAIIAGDWNAEPVGSEAALLHHSGRFAPHLPHGATFPSDLPRRGIDWIRIPKGWEIIETRVWNTALSDHRPVLLRVRPP